MSIAQQRIYHQHPKTSTRVDLLERSFLDKCDFLQMGQERLGCLGDDVQDPHSSLILAYSPPMTDVPLGTR
jgi:hypothetical protein